MNTMITVFFYRLLRLTLLVLLLGCTASQADPLRLATTTSTDNSGLLDLLLPKFEQQTGYRLSTYVVGSGLALQMGRAGKVDVLLTHSPDAETVFMEQGHGAAKRAIMSNEFILVGPEKDPAGVTESASAAEAFKRIAEHRSLFVSRGDTSGTHRTELNLWKASEVSPYWQDWYYELGAGMGATLVFASLNEGYTLTDSATWLNKKHHLRLKQLYRGDPALKTVYSVITVNPKQHAQVNYQGAIALQQWFSSQETQVLIGNYRINNQPLFTPLLYKRSGAP